MHNSSSQCTLWHCGTMGLGHTIAHYDTLWHNMVHYGTLWHTMAYSYLIFVLFSPQAQFLNKFFSTQKCVNRDKIDFAPIQRKWQQSRFRDKSAWIVTKKIVSTFIMWRNVSTWQILLHISPHDMIFLFIYHVETYLQLNICHVEKLLHMTICHMENFLHMTIFFSTHTGCDGCDKYQVWNWQV